MKNAIILHGTSSKGEYFDSSAPTLGNAHWGPWLTKQLMINGMSVAKLEIPNAYTGHIQEYNMWRKEIERFDVTDQTVLIGHSCGAGFLLRWLTENSRLKVHTLALVATWLDPKKEYGSFLDFEIDAGIGARVRNLIMFSSQDDDEEVQEGTKKVLDMFPNVKHLRYADKGHFTKGDLGTEEFPELLEEILKNA